MHPMTIARPLNGRKYGSETTSSQGLRTVSKSGTNHTSTIDGNTKTYFDGIVSQPNWEKDIADYLEHTRQVLQELVPANKKVLLVGCLTSSLLEAVNPAYGVAIDISKDHTGNLQEKNTNPNLHYFHGVPEDFKTEEKFDYVLLVNFVDHTQDILFTIETVSKFIHEETKVFVSFLNPAWHPIIKLASFLGYRIRDNDRNLVATRQLNTAFETFGMRVSQSWRRVLVPRKIPLVSTLFNTYLSRFSLLNRFCFVQCMVATPMASVKRAGYTCTVLVPCYNEEGNVEECVRRVPLMGKYTEIIVIDDGSKDKTLEIANGMKKDYPNLKVLSYGENRGKGEAILFGMKHATGDVMMILDADMTVPPEELTGFFEAIKNKAADFVSGTRFVYPMEDEAMRTANYAGNVLFSYLVNTIVGSPCSDTLCGTKAMRRLDFQDFKLEDKSWGDFDLIFHASKRRLRSIEIPVHYKNRTAGQSKMRAFHSGIQFLRLCFKKWAENA